MTLTIAALEPGTTLVTVNNRLAAELRGRYDRRRLDAGQSVWPSADILPWNAWLQRLYTRLLDDGRIDQDLLSPYQERLVWEQLIGRQTGGPALLRPTAAADLAREAFALCLDWQLDARTLLQTGGEDTRHFVSWRETFERHLDHGHLLSAAQLPERLNDAFARGLLPSPERLAHAGFDTLSPSQQTLFDTLERLGCPVVELREPACEAERRRVDFADATQEIGAAARWARDRLQAAPEARIGIVSPRLAQQRGELERIFAETLAPVSFLEHRDAASLFNISLGRPLADCPMVAHALLALRLLDAPLSLAEIGQLLRSPFLGGHGAEWEGRALLDRILREDGLPQVDLGRLHYRLHHRAADDLAACPDLLARLTSLRELRRTLPKAASPNQWAARLQSVLQRLGWPGDAGLDSREYQQHERMLRLFSDLAALGKVRPRMRLNEALTQIRSLASETVFQAQSGPAPIQILGGLEAAGMGFDALWLLGMDDQAWPPPPRPNPLIPTAVQRERGMPHASAERELGFAARLTERLAGSAPLVIASHARMDAEQAQRPSPLITAWTPLDTASLVSSDAPALREACRAVARLEAMPAPQAAGGPREASGGAALLAAQSRCPFAAAARHRLKAGALPEASFTPDPALLGSILHEALQRIWQALRDSTSLAAQDREALSELVRVRVDAVLADLGRRRPDLFNPRFRALEAERLTRLLLDWLDCERGRTQAFEVLALEQDRILELGPLSLKTRADRVDRLADGSLAVIDYKSGRRVGSQGWFDDRLSEPQLPLYCLHESGEVSATLLARVRRDGPGCTFVGLSRNEGFAPGVVTPESAYEDTDWTRLLAHWQASIDALVAEITEGRADPTPSPPACEYCDLGALCRVRDMLSEADDG